MLALTGEKSARQTVRKGHRAKKDAIVRKRRRNYINACFRPRGDLSPELLPERHEEAFTGLADAAPHHDASGVEEHDGSLKPQRQVDHIPAHEFAVEQEFF